jgi:acyl carrier protein
MTGTPARDDLLEVLRVELRAVGDEIPDELPADRTLGEELGIDSLDVVEFVARVEYRYQVLVPDEDWQQLMTLDAVADYMLGRLRDG